jgi:hypothetical protein
MRTALSSARPRTICDRCARFGDGLRDLIRGSRLVLDWQMECCGEPFAVGDSVEWSLTDEPDVDWLEAAIGTELAADITHQEDHHDAERDVIVRRGKVLSIRCAYCRYAPKPGGDERTLYP